MHGRKFCIKIAYLVKNQVGVCLTHERILFVPSGFNREDTRYIVYVRVGARCEDRELRLFFVSAKRRVGKE